jgi:hypothetical protein
MSILDNNEPVAIPQATRTAHQLINMTVRCYQQMVDNFNRGAIIFWQNPQGLTPTEIAAELGTNAKEIFELHYKLGQLLGSVKPEAIQEGIGLVRDFSYNEDGSISISEPQPQPEPEN